MTKPEACLLRTGNRRARGSSTRALLFSAAAVGLLASAPFSGCAASDDNETSSGNDCSVGSEGCPCTNGGACDPGLVCLSNLCVNPVPAGSGGASTGTGAGGAGGSDFTTSSSGSGGSCETGCSKVDVLFALDGSGSMAEEINALSATQSFTGIIDALSALNCGGIDYRIGVTDDNDGGFQVPGGWAGAHPWFDSTELTKDEMIAAFNGAAAQVVAGSGTALGCEHVLSSSIGLMDGDSTGFLRPDALLVLILVTDVDDYGAYDQVGGHTCPRFGGCSVPGQPVADLYATVTGLKGGDPAAVATIIVAGDPNMPGGVNLCDQPGSCCSSPGLECEVFHADRLWQFASMQSGMNGVTANLCQGAQVVPQAVKTAFEQNIDLACEEFEPPK